MTGRVAFFCERSGLGAALLGGYDGAGSWRVLIEHVTDKDEHLVVQAHEAMHHELQTSTAWGSLVAMAGTLAKQGVRRHALMEVFDVGVELSTNVHEVYATVLADAMGRQRWSRDPLDGNLRYQAFRDRGQALIPSSDGIDEGIRVAAIAAVLRCCMQPAHLADMAAGLDFGAVRAESLTNGPSPDERLALFEAATSHADWMELLAELTEADPGHQQRILAESRPTRREDMVLLEAQWEFETKVVQKRCYELTARVIASLGAPSIPWIDLTTVTSRIIAAVAETDEELARIVRLAEDRAPEPGADVLEFSRQAVTLRAPLRLEIASHDTASTIRLLDGFIVESSTSQPHLCAIWCLPAVLTKQFECSDAPASMCALFTRAREADGTPVARVGFLDPGTTPQDVQKLAGDLPVVALSTHYSLTDDTIVVALDDADPVYVLMDLPIGWHVSDWVRQGGRVRYAAVTVDADKELGAVVFSIDRTPNFHFFHVGGLLALGSLLERLRQRHDSDSVRYDDDVIHSDIAGLSLAISHVVHTFSTLDQDAVA